MRIDPKDAVTEIVGVLATQPNTNNGISAERELAALYEACIARLAPPGSSYAKRLAEMKRPGISAKPFEEIAYRDQLGATLRALQSDYSAGRTRVFEELVNASLFE